MRASFSKYWKLAGITPTTECFSPLSRISRLTMLRSPP
jgi:hypothetical protein